MFFHEGYSCPVCGKPFTETDDIVSCPDCGAPHHRACWGLEGRCHFENLHGTAQQWSREGQHPADEEAEKPQPEKAVCPYCGQENPSFCEFCSRCGRELPAKDWQSRGNDSEPIPPFSPFGGAYREYRPFRAPVSPDNMPDDDTDINGVSAAEMRWFVGQNAPFYLPRFLKFSKGKSAVSWNWAAFLLAPYWLWYRKQYFAGSLMLIFELFRTAVSTFITYTFIGVSSINSASEIAKAADSIAQNPTAMRWFLLFYVILFVELLLRLLFGLLGNYFYYQTARRRIQKSAFRNSADAIARSGGISFGLAAAIYVLLNLVTTLFGFLFM